jgi:hypothetical protein
VTSGPPNHSACNSASPRFGTPDRSFRARIAAGNRGEHGRPTIRCRASHIMSAGGAAPSCPANFAKPALRPPIRCFGGGAHSSRRRSDFVFIVYPSGPTAVGGSIYPSRSPMRSRTPPAGPFRRQPSSLRCHPVSPVSVWVGALELTHSATRLRQRAAHTLTRIRSTSAPPIVS